MLHAVIMAGGAGTRFWPASRADRPKQLLDLTGEGSMLQSTVARLDGLCPPEQILIVTNQRTVEAIRKQLPQLPPESIVGEPCKRDTAPCVGWSAGLLRARDEDAVLAVMPADHVIRPREAFQEAIRRGVETVAEQPGRIVTFGIPPTYAATGFGYIQRGERLGSQQPAVHRVARFREKPRQETAEQYLASGDFYWNAGIFIWKASTILDSLRRFEPEMSARLDAIAAAAAGPQADEVLQREFAAIDGKSIDYAVLERHDDVCVIEAPFQWDDLGSWRAMARLMGEDADGNTFIGKHLQVGTQGTIVRSDDSHLVVTLGLRDCIVVHTPDATLVASKHDEEAIREVVRRLQELGWHEHL